MRLVAVADTHLYQADLGTLPEGDVFVHAGDLLRSGTIEELCDVTGWIRSLPHRTKIVIAGNHDRCFVRDGDVAAYLLGEEVTYLQDRAAIVDGLKFWGSPWQPEFRSWAFNLPCGPELAEKWALIPDDTDVLVTHGPPMGFGDRSRTEGRSGCEDLAVAVRRVKPALHLFGHIHQDGGFWRDGDVCLANVTTWECERGATVIDIDPVSRAVTEVTIPPTRAGA